jgi:hypothetical protein
VGGGGFGVREKAGSAWYPHRNTRVTARTDQWPGWRGAPRHTEPAIDARGPQLRTGGWGGGGSLYAPATGMLEVLATKQVRFMMPISLPSTVVVSSGKSDSTSAISLPRSPHPTYTMQEVLEYLDSAWEMHVLPHPKAPGMAHVPPSTDLWDDTHTHTSGTDPDTRRARGRGWVLSRVRRAPQRKRNQRVGTAPGEDRLRH